MTTQTDHRHETAARIAAHNEGIAHASAWTINTAHSELIAKLAAIKPPAIPTFPEPEDLQLMAGHLRAVAIAVDTYVLAVGRECQSNVRSSLDLSLFIGPLTNALDGNAIYEIECCAEEIADENEQYDKARYHEGVGG